MLSVRRPHSYGDNDMLIDGYILKPLGALTVPIFEVQRTPNAAIGSLKRKTTRGVVWASNWVRRLHGSDHCWPLLAAFDRQYFL